MSLLDVAVAEGGFEPVKDLKGGPVTNEQVLENIRKSADLNLPVFKKKPQREGSFIFTAGGTSLLDFVDEIKKRKESGEFICSSNHTHDFLFERGIVSDACIVIDPKECVKNYIKHPQKETNYYIGTVCHPAVAQNLIDAGMNVEKLLVGYGIEDESDIELQKALYGKVSSSYLVGGTMTGLRAMHFAVMLGFKTIEYYGLDSCFSSECKLVYKGDPRFNKIIKKNGGRWYSDAETGQDYALDETEDGGFFYAYKKPRAENIQIAKTPDGRQFITSPVFAHQAKQFIKWYDRMEGKLNIILHGDNLTSHLLKCHLIAKDRILKEIGDKRWTEDYSKLQKTMHENREDYGSIDKLDVAEIVCKAVIFLYAKLRRPIRVLDYGCGKGRLSENLSSILKIVEVTNYDPFTEWSKEPEGKFDIVTCIDVMEHVEEECVNNTLRYIQDKAGFMALFYIAMDDALKLLPDGRNAHITQKSVQWWLSVLKEKFLIGEATTIGDWAWFICQSLDASEKLKGGL